jgi:hypothetical protein
MATQWVVTNAAERIDLTDKNSVDTTFTVSNKGRVADRAVFEVVPGDGADPSWFAVEDPQRVVPANGSAAYLVDVTIPPTAPAGSYSLQGRVYSADTAPEEGSVLSGRVLFQVGPQTPVKKPFPWWIPVAAGLLVLVIGIVTWLVLASGNEPAANAGPAPTAPATSAPADVKVPNLVSLTMDQATAELNGVGLTVGTVKHKHDPAQDGKILQQGAAAAATVPGGTAVDLVVGVSLAAPAITAPGNGGSFGGGTQVDVRWDQSEPWVPKWQIVTHKESCYYWFAHETRDCRWDHQGNGEATAKTFRTAFNLDYQPALNLGRFNTGKVKATVYAMDDFGTLGPGAAVDYYIR